MSNKLEIHTTVTDFVNKAQDMVLDNLNKVAGSVAEQLPTIPVGPANDYVVKSAELVDGGFLLAGDLVAGQRTFVAGLFGVASTLLAGFGETKIVAVPAKKTSAKKAA